MNCDFLAPWYRWLEYLTFGRALERRRLHYLDRLTQARKILVLGDGDGRFLAELVKKKNGAMIQAVDSSAGMLRLAERRVRRITNGERVQFLLADARVATNILGNFDAVVAHFFLDCFSAQDLPDLVARIRKSAAPGALWVVSEFQIPACGPSRLLAQVVIRALYFAFRILTGLKTNRLPDYRKVLRQAGFVCLDKHEALGGLLVSELWRLPPN